MPIRDKFRGHWCNLPLFFFTCITNAQHCASSSSLYRHTATPQVRRTSRPSSAATACSASRPVNPNYQLLLLRPSKLRLPPIHDEKQGAILVLWRVWSISGHLFTTRSYRSPPLVTLIVMVYTIHDETDRNKNPIFLFKLFLQKWFSILLIFYKNPYFFLLDLRF